MSLFASAKFTVYVALSSFGLIGAVIAGRPELAALVVPFAALAALAVAWAAPEPVACRLELDRERALSGEEVGLTLTLESPSAVDLDVLLELEPGLATEDEHGREARLRAGETRLLDYEIRAERWGLYRPAVVELRSVDRLGFFFERQRVDLRRELRVYPRPAELSGLIAPRQTLALSGDLVSRVKGEGLEFADLREFAEGDRMRRINWTVSARRGRLHVNDYHPERNAEVILFLDTLVDLEADGASTLDRTVQAAAGLAEAHLRRRDRIGLVAYGGRLTWLTPDSGTRQRYRIVEALLTTRAAQSETVRAVDSLPRRLLPPRALVIAISPLTDQRSIDALFALRARGLDLAVIELPPPTPDAGPTQAGQLALRLWRLQRQATRALCESAGILTVPWLPDQPLAAPVEQILQWRRRPQRQSA